MMLLNWISLKKYLQNAIFYCYKRLGKLKTSSSEDLKMTFLKSECISASQMDLDGLKGGRPYGGVSICYHAGLKCKVERVPTESKSICALKICFEQINLLLVNVYMPCSDNIEALEKYENILEEISSICIKSDTQHLLLAGDWNADPRRRDGRTTLFKNYITQENLINALDNDLANVPYTY